MRKVRYPTMGQNNLTEDKLRENGIIFDVNLVTFENLSREHAEAANVQQGLLDFENILTRSSLVYYLTLQLVERNSDLIHVVSVGREDTINYCGSIP